MAEQRDNLNLSGQTDVRLSFVGDIFRGTTNCNGTGFRGNGFKNAIFEGPATFNSAKFHSGADFTGAVFKDHADFENAEFYGGAVDFSGAVFLAGASFKKAKFGNPSQRTFGQWDIRFSLNTSGDGLCSLEIKRVGETKEKWTKATEFPFWSDPSFYTLLGTFEIKVIHDEIAKAFREFRNSPQSVSFSGCRFGEMNIDGFPEEKIKEVLTKERKRVEREPEDTLNEEKQSLKLFEDHCEKNNPNLSELKKTTIMAILSKHLEPTSLRKECLYKENQGVTFTQTSFYPQRDVTFERTLFLTGGHVGFKSAIFGNGGYVGFDSVTFGNGGYVGFDSVTFGNGGNVWFGSASFSNGRDVGFSSATFSNGGNVGFGSATFSNGGNVEFDSATFGNGGNVWFGSASFSNGRDVGFSSASFSNSGIVGFYSATFSNGGYVRFNSATFSNGGYVGFDSATFSNGGYVWFNSASFGNGEDVWFRSATFSNGAGVWFRSVNFGNKRDVDFSKIIWINGGNLNFFNMAFRETLPVKFDECLFLCAGNISFKEARFPEKGSLMFQRCYFGKTKEVDFTGAVFRHTSFEGGEISWLKKEGKTLKEILEARLGGKYDSLSTMTQKELRTRTTPVFEEGVEVLWKDLTTESAKNLTLRRVNLSHSIFDGMTLSHIQLNAPQWFEKDGRRMLFEETNIKRDIRNLENIEDQYTQLKNNLEKQGNYQNAGYFHYGEQEIRREILWKKRSCPNWFLSWCYKRLSGYGERPLRAFISTFVIAFLFSFVLAWLNTSPKIETLWANVCFFSCWPSFQELMTTDVCKLFKSFVQIGIEKSFKSFVELITPFSWKETATSLDEWTKLKGFKAWRLPLLIFFQVLFLGIQLPLLVLAVRRRFKR